MLVCIISLALMSVSSHICNCSLLQDKMLSKEEIVSNFDLFVGSQATEWGDYMMRHDEF